MCKVSICLFLFVLMCMFECGTERGNADAEALCLQKQLFHPPLYLSHAQKVLPQTLTVPRPYLRFPWRFLHPQVGKPHSPFTCSRMCRSFPHYTHTTCGFWCVPSLFVHLIHSERSEVALFLYRCDCSTHHTFTQEVN